MSLWQQYVRHVVHNPIVVGGCTATVTMFARLQPPARGLGGRGRCGRIPRVSHCGALRPRRWHGDSCHLASHDGYQHNTPRREHQAPGEPSAGRRVTVLTRRRVGRRRERAPGRCRDEQAPRAAHPLLRAGGVPVKRRRRRIPAARAVASPAFRRPAAVAPRPSPVAPWSGRPPHRPLTQPASALKDPASTRRRPSAAAQPEPSEGGTRSHPSPQPTDGTPGAVVTVPCKRDVTV